MELDLFSPETFEFYDYEIGFNAIPLNFYCNREDYSLLTLGAKVLLCISLEI